MLVFSNVSKIYQQWTLVVWLSSQKIKMSLCTFSYIVCLIIWIPYLVFYSCFDALVIWCFDLLSWRLMKFLDCNLLLLLLFGWLIINLPNWSAMSLSAFFFFLLINYQIPLLYLSIFCILLPWPPCLRSLPHSSATAARLTCDMGIN